MTWSGKGTAESVALCSRRLWPLIELEASPSQAPMAGGQTSVGGLQSEEFPDTFQRGVNADLRVNTSTAQAAPFSPARSAPLARARPVNLSTEARVARAARAA